MRIRLQKGKQKELISLAKNGKSWRELTKIIEKNQHYLSFDMYNELRLLDEKDYKTLCETAKVNFDEYILEKLNDNWGRSKGGMNSRGVSIKQIRIPKRDERLAEFIGIVLGDGNITCYIRGKKVRVYQVNIAGDKRWDKDYHLIYIRRLCKELFDIESKEKLSKTQNARHLILSSKILVNFLLENGLKPGDKIRNQSTMPKWIWKKKKNLRACIRGLIDTDGSIHRMSNQDPNLLRISFKNHDATLLNDTREAFIKLGFHPSKIILGKNFCLSRQKEITKYLKEIGFSNNKHKNRFKMLTSLMV